MFIFFFFKQKTAYEIYQCDWSSDVCSSDLIVRELLDDSIFRPASALGLDRGMIALQKTEPDNTRWDWYEPF